MILTFKWPCLTLSNMVQRCLTDIWCCIRLILTWFVCLFVFAIVWNNFISKQDRGHFVIFFALIRFGGDPNKVTIFGGSSGGMCVALLMLSPLASGLYKNVIMQSGTAAALSSAMEMNEAHSPAR